MPRLGCRCESGWPHHFTPPWPTQKGTCFVNRSMWVQNPPEAPFRSRCFPWCNSSTSLCEGDGAGAEPAGKPNFNIVRKAKKPSQWFASPPYPVRVRGARPALLPRCKSDAYCRAKAEARGASPRGSAIRGWSDGEMEFRNSGIAEQKRASQTVQANPPPLQYSIISSPPLLWSVA